MVRKNKVDNELIADKAGSCQHTGLPVLGKGLRVSGQTSGVPSVVSWEFTGQVRWASSLAEWAEPLDAVWAIEFDSLGDLSGGLQSIKRTKSFD